MPENQSETYDILKRTVDEGYSVVNDIERSVKCIANHSCVTVIENGLQITDTSFESFIHLMVELGSMYLSGEVKGLLIKFYLGDAANQGEEIWGDTSYQVYDNNVPYRYSYLKNVRWVCRMVAPENRSLKLNWKWHQSIAPLSHEEQKRFTEYAIQLKEQGNKGWCAEAEQMINDEKICEMLREMSPEDKATYEPLIEQYAPTWTLLRMWMNGDKEAPMLRTDVATWIKTRLSSMALNPDDLDSVVKAMFALADGVKSKQIVTEARELKK